MLISAPMQEVSGIDELVKQAQEFVGKRRNDIGGFSLPEMPQNARQYG